MTNKTTAAAKERQCNDSTQNLPLYADCFIFLHSLVASINQPISKHLTQAKISTTNINANRMDMQLDGNVQKYAGEGRDTPSEVMECVSPCDFHLNTVQHSS